MFGAASGISSGLTFSKVIGGVSKTLGIVNQIIPIYREAKPIISNARSMFSIVKEFGSNSSNNINYQSDNIENKQTKKSISNTFNPVFFQ